MFWYGGRWPTFLFCIGVMAVNLEDIVKKSIEGMKFECVSAEHLPGGLLRIIIDRGIGHKEFNAGITIEDCEACSRHLQYVFLVEGIEYRRLEVSSPGLDRPLRNQEDFRRFIGHLVFVEMKLPVQKYCGRKKFRGRLLNFIDNCAHIQLDVAVSDMLPGKQLRVHMQSQCVLDENTYPVTRHKGNLLPAMVELELAGMRSACLIPQIDFRKRKK